MAVFFAVWSLLFSPPLLFFSAFQQSKQSGTINNTQENRTVRSIRLSLSGEGSNVGLMWCLCYRSRFGATVDIFQPFGFLRATFWKFLVRPSFRLFQMFKMRIITWHSHTHTRVTLLNTTTMACNKILLNQVPFPHPILVVVVVGRGFLISDSV